MSDTRPYALQRGEGWIYDFGDQFVVKAGERAGGKRVAVLEYEATEDEWPGHTHRTEDEIFYVLSGSMTFGCGDQTFDVDAGGFVFLPCGIKHGYKLRDGKPARVLVITTPSDTSAEGGWGGFIADIEDPAHLKSAPTA